MRDEQSVYRDVFTQAQALTSLDGKPLVVITVTESLSDIAGWSAAQTALAALSSNSVHRVIDATHGGMLDDPNTFGSSVLAIGDVVQIDPSRRTGGHQMTSRISRARTALRSGPCSQAIESNFMTSATDHGSDQGGSAVGMMAAIVHDSYGPSAEDVLRVAEVAKPTIGTVRFSCG